MTDQPKPAPTAEEQLPEPAVTDADIDDAIEMIQDDFRAGELAIYLAATRERDAALRSNREKDAQLQRMGDLVRHQRGELFGEGLIDQDEYAALCADSENGKRVARLESYDGLRAEKDAKIAALEEQSDEWETHAGNHVDRIRKLEFNLRAVSEALNNYYAEGRVDVLLARLRSIADGKD